MKIKMLRYYHGYLMPGHNGMVVGETYDVPDDVGKQLIERGIAEDATPKTRAAQASEGTKIASRRKTKATK